MAATPAYHRDPFATTLGVHVLDAGVTGERAWVLTGDTILFPGGGGQPADEGTLAGLAVTSVSKTHEGWRHDLAAPRPPAGSDRVEVVIDWARRFDHMQQHTAQHLLSALAQDRWGWATTAFHLGRDRSDVELAVPSLSREQMDALEEAVMQVVRAARPVTSRWVSVAEYQALGTRSRGLPEGHEGEVRLVEIGGVDLTACGGTHLSSTAEIEAVALLAAEPMRGGTRLDWVAGGRLRARLALHEARTDALRRVLGVPDDQLVAQAEARRDQLLQLERRVRDAEARLAEETAARLALAEGGVVEAHFEGLDATFLKAVVSRLQTGLGARVALLTSESEGARAFVVVAGAEAGLDLRAAGQRVAELLEGRGGGAGLIFQGRAGSLARRAEAVQALSESSGTTPGS